jgi:hypothetical protein
MHRKIVASSITICVSLSLISCTQMDKTSSGINQFFSPISSASDFSQVCNGIALETAPSYLKDTAPQTIAIFEQKDRQLPFELSYQFPKSWELTGNDAKNNQLVTCIRITEQSLNKKCDDYEVSDEKTKEKRKAVLELYNATYEVTIYEAKTAKTIATKLFNLKTGECPILMMFNSGSLMEKEYPKHEQVVIDFVKPYIQP